MTKLIEVSSSKCFGGYQKVYSHNSEELKCKMNFSIYLPPKVINNNDIKVPVMYWLSGLESTEQDFITKSGFQRYAAENDLIVVGPDTCPRGCEIEVEGNEKYLADAGFYVDATQPKWKDNYRMYSYVTKEIPRIIEENFPVLPDKCSVSGTSMGGHGALICALKNPGKYKAVTVFAPVSNPTKGRWGRLCLNGYLGPNEQDWVDWDATLLVEKYNGPPLNILIDQGNNDKYLEKELLTDNFVEACGKSKNVQITYYKHDGYNHSYYFYGTFIGNHIKHHAKILYAS